ncbi:hypothetical protein GLOIN_2v1565967, partial [Rhizophagus irregularis DAOM 181602=DAOM 197198]
MTRSLLNLMINLSHVFPILILLSLQSSAESIMILIINLTKNKLTMEAEKKNKAQACRNEFGRINVVIENLQNEINQHYTIVQRSNFDQQSVSNESEANSTNESETNSRGSSSNSSPSSSSGSSNLFGILDITSDIKIRFKQHFDRLMKARNYTFDE